MGKIIVVGLGPGEREWITPRAEQALAQASLVVVAKRNLPLVTQNPNIYIMEKMSEAMAEIEKYLPAGDVAVCATGDPGVYSLLQRVKRHFPYADLHVISGIGSLQLLCDRLGEGREHAVVLSAHGRDLTDAKLLGTILHHEQTLLLLDDTHNVEWLCKTLLFYGMENVELAVGENLSYASQRVVVGSPQALIKEKYSNLCVARVLNATPNPVVINFGLHDDAFVRGDAPMTKSEVRAVALSKLQLTSEAIVWDVGAGTGSVSVECARICTMGLVYSIEKEPQALELLDENKKRFHLPNMRIERGEALSVLKDLPEPTHVFVGGSGAELPELLRAVAGFGKRIRVVVSAITLETLALAAKTLSAPPFKSMEATQVSISNSRLAGSYHIMSANNPVTLLSAWTEGE